MVSAGKVYKEKGKVLPALQLNGPKVDGENWIYVISQMDPLENSEKGKVRSLVSRFLHNEPTEKSAGSKDEKKKLKTTQQKSGGSVSERSEHSIDHPLAFKGSQLKTTVPKSSQSVSARSEHSIDHPLAFKGSQLKTPVPKSSQSVSARSEHSIDHPLAFKGSHLKRTLPKCDGSVSARSEHSIDHPLAFKGSQLKTTLPKSNVSVSARSEHSIEHPLAFKRSQLKTTLPKSSDYVIARSEHSMESPLAFKGSQLEPDCDYSLYETESDFTSKDICPLANRNQVNCGVPKHWGRQAVYNLNPPRFPPLAVYPVQQTNHKSLDDVINSRMKLKPAEYSGYETASSKDGFRKNKQWDLNKAKSVSSSETSDYSSAHSKDSHYSADTASYDDIHEELMCDTCDTNTAVKICLTCNYSFCEFDAKEHHKLLPRHILADVSSDFSGTTQIPGDEDLGQPHAVVPPPGKIKFLSVKPHSVVVSWGCPQELQGPKSFKVKWRSLMEAEGSFVIKDIYKIEIDNLQLGQQYMFSVATQDEDGNLSEWVTARVTTAVPPPRKLTKGHSEATSLSLQWTKGENMEEIAHQFLIKVTSPGKEPQVIHTKDCYKIFSDLEPDTEYEFSVSTLLKDNCSDPVCISEHTEPCLREVLSRIGLEDQYDSKLSIRDFLEISQHDTTENKFETPKSLCEAFLKSLVMLNINARKVKSVSGDLEADKKNTINPLDLITAVFLCSDSFLQQVLVMKMALCQFAVPLLLPNSETREITMMLWSMREIVRTFRPSQQAFRRLNCEERLVLFDVPLVSFVRLGKKFMSKSRMVNKLLSNAEQYHDTFCHSELVCGDVPRRISDGLVEVSWYLPCGSRSIDKFCEPLAVANLRGDLRAFNKQFSFLCQTSTAIYIFCDESEHDYFKNFEGKRLKAKVILVSSRQGKTSVLKMMTTAPSLKMKDMSQTNKNDTELLQALQKSVSEILESNPKKVSLANLADKARCCEILIDEDSDGCQSAWKNVHKITASISKTSEFKEQELPSQGHTWKALSWLETEQWRLRKVGNRNTEEYRKSLTTKEKVLKKKQQRFEVSAVMLQFLQGVYNSVQCNYFLKWMEIELEDLSRPQLSTLQDRYKDLNERSPKETETIAEIDNQISACSLRVDHFFRECGQLYACASGLPEHSKQRKTVEQFPALYAQMLLDGFPLELVDGDAANIPMKWITDVLTELHHIMQCNSQLKVITAIGAENSGKSTLLNTMFGVRFAVNKGTCTRGAFMQLIRVSKDVSGDLGCDCILIIDTEGLKPHQMVQDDHSHERDKEIASLALALSDAAIVSVSKDGCTDPHILKVVLHALTRAKGVDRKPLCHFVHGNISGMPANEKKERDRELLEKLNVMILRNAELKKAKKLSDVMDFDPNTWSWNIPPIWKGTPPMAPFSVDYSETAQALKKRLLWDLKKCPNRGDLTHFIKKIQTLWKAV